MIGDIGKIQKDGFNALTRELGTAGTVIFLRQFESSEGNYMEERENMHTGLTINDIVARIQQQKTEEI